MCLLWLVFGLPLLGVFLLPVIALVFGLNAIANAVQNRKSGEGEPLSAEEFRQRNTNQIAIIAFGLLCLFLGFLVVRYQMT